MATVQPTLARRPDLARFLILAAVAAFAVLVSVHFYLTVLDTLANRGKYTPPPNPAATATALSVQQTMDAAVEATLTALAPTATPKPTFTLTPTATATPTTTPSPTATPLPKPGAKRVSKIDGMTSVYIPAGKFSMGRPSGQHEYPDQPRHPVTLDAFWMNRNQVTNAQYARCVKAKACNPPIRKEINPHYYDPAFARHPAVYISWENAAQYCAWVGGRMPTEAEWERSAGGGGKRLYPWGGEGPRPGLANIQDMVGTTVEVGSNPDGASPFGVQDMGGNVREWVADWFDPNFYYHSPEVNPQGPKKGEKKVLRGAGFNDPPEYSRVYFRLAHVPNSPGANRGFRCAFSQ